MDGVSFVIRVRNEEETLEANLRSLKGLTIPYEIIVVLHLCTDRSREIAETLQAEGFPIRIFEYTVKLSRCGYETMVTDATSVHSTVYYCNWCMAHAKYIWKVKWDADYVASDGIIAYFNSKTWTKPEISTQIWFDSKSEDGTNSEPFLFSGSFYYSKYFFWEMLDIDEQFIRLTADGYVHTLSKLSNMKSFWKEPKWFLEDSEEATIVRKRYETLENICGVEPLGQARALDPNNWIALGPATSKESILESLGVFARK